MLRFEPLVWIKEGAYALREVDSVEAAQAILDASALDARGPLFYATANTLASARDGSIAPSEAREAFWRYADDIGILAKSDEVG